LHRHREERREKREERREKREERREKREERTSIKVLCISRSADVPCENLLPPMASISSMKIMHGSCSLA